MDQWLIGSIGGALKEGKLPSVPAERRLEQSLFPARLHPRYSHNLEKQLLSAWGETYGCAWAKDIQKMRAHDLGGLAASFWPNSNDDKRTMTLIKLMLWFFLVDDAIDDLSGLQADKFSNRLIQAIFSAELSRQGPQLELAGDGGDETDPPPAHEKEPLLIAVGLEWWNEMQGSISPKQKARFAADFSKYLLDQAGSNHFKEKLVSETAANTRTCSRLLEEYIRNRRESSGFLQCVAMVEYDVGIELEEETLRNPLLQRLHEAVCDHISWLNDILSFPKEFANGDVHNNLLSVLHMRNNEGGKKAPFEAAVSEAWQMTYGRERECACLAQQLLDSAAAGGALAARQPGLEMYVKAVCGLTAGIWAWSLQSPRYQVHTSSPTGPWPLELLRAPKPSTRTPSLFSLTTTTTTTTTSTSPSLFGTSNWNPTLCRPYPYLYNPLPWKPPMEKLHTCPYTPLTPSPSLLGTSIWKPHMVKFLKLGLVL